MRVKRTYLMRKVELWDVTEQGAPDPEEFGEFDEFVVGTGALLEEHFEVMDNDELMVDWDKGANGGAR